MTPRNSDAAIAALLVQFDGTGPTDPAEAVRFCDELESWLNEHAVEGTASGAEHQKQRADLWFMQGMLCQRRGELEAALVLLEKSIDQSKLAHYSRRHILGLRSLSMCFETAGMQAQSTRCILEALDLADNDGDTHTLALVSHALTALYQAQGAYAQMLESALRTRELAERVDDSNLLIRVYSSVGVALARLGRVDEGFSWIDRAAALPVDESEPLVTVYFGLNRMLLLRFAGRIEEAAELADDYVDLIDDIPSADAARLAVLIAEIHLDVGHLEAAEDMLDRAALVARSEQMTSHLIDYYAAAANLNEAKGDPKTALGMIRRHNTLAEEIRGREAESRLVALERHSANEIASKTEEIHHLRTVELVEKNRQLSDLVHQKDEILHVVAHDLRNPLAAAQLLGESLMFDLRGKVGADSFERLEFVRDAAIEMRDTIDTLLDSQQTGLASDPAMVSTAVEGVIRDANPRCEARGVIIDLQGSDVDVMVDSALLRRALDDLLSNAVESVAPGNAVRISVDRTTRGARITLSGNDIIFDARDGGGRGLYIARRLIERMNGSLSVDAAGSESPTAVIELRSERFQRTTTDRHP